MAHPMSAPSSATYGYVRVSTSEQAVDRSSLVDQERRITGAALMRGDDIARMYSDPGVSGSVPLGQRPCGRDLLAVVRTGDTIIAAKMDRMFRSAQDALNCSERLRKAGVNLVLVDMGSDPVTSNGTSRLFFTMLAAFAEFERERIVERTADGRAGKAARGGHTGGSAPYGWIVDGEGRDAMLIELPDEQKILASAIALRRSGLTLRAVAATLAATGHFSRSGRPFAAQQIDRMLMSCP